MKTSFNPSRPPKDAFEDRLAHLLEKPLLLTVTDNTRSMISIRRCLPGYDVRLHHMFLEADDSVLKSLAHYISGKDPDRAAKTLRSFIAINQAKIRRTSRSVQRRQSAIRSRGRHYHLQEVFEHLNRAYFEERADCRISWGYRRRRPGRRSIRLGSYCPERRLIRINPILDDALVPPYVIEHIVYHEMLHHCLGVRKKNGRRILHGTIFRKRERKFACESKARAWLKRHLPTLMV